MVGVVEVYLRLCVACNDILSGPDQVVAFDHHIGFEMHGCFELSCHGHVDILRKVVPAYGVRGRCFEDALFRFFLTLFKKFFGLLGDLGLFGENGLAESAADAGSEALRPRVVVLRVAMVGDDHVGRRGNLEITLTGGLGGYVASSVHCINMLGCFHNAKFAVLLYRLPLGDR